MSMTGAQRHKSLQKLVENEHVLQAKLDAHMCCRHEKVMMELVAQAVKQRYTWERIEMEYHNME